MTVSQCRRFSLTIGSTLKIFNAAECRRFPLTIAGNAENVRVSQCQWFLLTIVGTLKSSMPLSAGGFHWLSLDLPHEKEEDMGISLSTGNPEKSLKVSG
ncbi:hypothetical protein FB451DRAFT_1369292, partial [Mycena latifolia]